MKGKDSSLPKTKQSQDEGREDENSSKGNKRPGGRTRTRSQTSKGKSAINYSEEDEGQSQAQQQEEVTMESLQKMLQSISMKIDQGTERLEQITNQRFGEIMIGVIKEGSSCTPPVVQQAAKIEPPTGQLPSTIFNAQRPSLRIIVDGCLLDGSSAVSVSALCSQPHLRSTSEIVTKVLQNALKRVSGSESPMQKFKTSTSTLPSVPFASTSAVFTGPIHLSPSTIQSRSPEDTKSQISPAPGLLGWVDQTFVGVNSTSSQSSFTPISSTENAAAQEPLGAYSEVRLQTMREVEEALISASANEMSMEAKAEILKETLINEITKFKTHCARLDRNERMALERAEEESNRRRQSESREAENQLLNSENVQNLMAVCASAQSRVVELEELLEAEKRKNASVDQSSLGFRLPELMQNYEDFMSNDSAIPDDTTNPLPFNLNTSTVTASNPPNSSSKNSTSSLYHPYPPQDRRPRLPGSSFSRSFNDQSLSAWNQSRPSPDFRSLSDSSMPPPPSTSFVNTNYNAAQVPSRANRSSSFQDNSAQFSPFNT